MIITCSSTNRILAVLHPLSLKTATMTMNYIEVLQPTPVAIDADQSDLQVSALLIDRDSDRGHCAIIHSGIGKGLSIDCVVVAVIGGELHQYVLCASKK